MAFNPATDFLAIWRNTAGVLAPVEMPGLDYVVDALARAGLITLSVSATAPVVNQTTTAWLQTAVPSNTAEGTLQLWNAATAAYVPATPGLFFDMLQAAANQSGISWWPTTGGPPVNTVGNNGDYAIRSDNPGGVYGPKALGAWPASPIPGTTATISSLELDNSFGTTEGALIFRGPAVWQALELGAANTVAVSSGVTPGWETLSALMDAVFSNVQGSILYRDVGLWEALAPGAAGLLLTSGGPAADPSWQAAASLFPSGTVMLFQQSSAPTGWTKLTALNDYGLRVVNGAVGTTPGTAFSTVFAQSAVGNTTITQATMPSHSHTTDAIQFNNGAGVGTGASDVPGNVTATINSTGSDGPHTHSINLALSYVDVIMASKN